MPEQNYVATRAFASNARHYAVADPVPRDLPGFGNVKAKGLVALDNSDEGIKAAERRRELEEAAEKRSGEQPPDHAEILRQLEEEAAPQRMGDYEEAPEQEAADPRPELSNPTPPLEGASLPGREQSDVAITQESTVTESAKGGDAAQGEEGAFASQAAADAAEEAGLSPAGIEGTGSGGKITKSDVDKAAREG